MFVSHISEIPYEFESDSNNFQYPSRQLSKFVRKSAAILDRLMTFSALTQSLEQLVIEYVHGMSL